MRVAALFVELLSQPTTNSLRKKKLVTRIKQTYNKPGALRFVRAPTSPTQDCRKIAISIIDPLLYSSAPRSLEVFPGPRMIRSPRMRWRGRRVFGGLAYFCISGVGHQDRRLSTGLYGNRFSAGRGVHRTGLISITGVPSMASMGPTRKRFLVTLRTMTS